MDSDDTDWGAAKLRMEETMAQARLMAAHPLNLAEDEPREPTLWDDIKQLLLAGWEERFMILMIVLIIVLVWKVFWPK